MLKFITNMQISRRLLFAFLLAAVIPGNYYFDTWIWFHQCSKEP